MTHCPQFINEGNPWPRTSAKRREQTVPMMLNGGRVLEGFRSEVWSAAARSGLSVNEFVLRATGAALVASGADIEGVFRPGDINTNNHHGFGA